MTELATLEITVLYNYNALKNQACNKKKTAQLAAEILHLVFISN